MSEPLIRAGLIYLAVISFISVSVTIADKIAAVREKRRVAERTLFTLAILGGSLAMFLTMLFIRHKVRKTKFMAGLPAVMIAQTALLLFILQ